MASSEVSRKGGGQQAPSDQAEQGRVVSPTTGLSSNTRVTSTVQRIIVYALLLGGLCIVMFLLVWMLSASIKPKSEIFSFPPTWIPSIPLWSNYPRGLE